MFWCFAPAQLELDGHTSTHLHGLVPIAQVHMYTGKIVRTRVPGDTHGQDRLPSNEGTEHSMVTDTHLIGPVLQE